MIPRSPVRSARQVRSAMANGRSHVARRCGPAVPRAMARWRRVGHGRFALAGSLWVLLLAFPSSARGEEEEGRDARVRVLLRDEAPLWVGAQATLDVELATTGLTFSDQLLALPEVPGALLLRLDSTTVKRTERRDGETWQILRYPVALFPQRAGALTVPPFDVRFTVGAGYGKATRSFRFETEPLTVLARLPDGVADGALLVTTPRYELSWSWSPAPDADEADSARVAAPGDAVTLRVTQRAAELSGMVLPPLSIHRGAGLAAYPSAPVIEDRVVRGALEGTRVDEVTWMLEAPGLQSFPSLRYRWFDPTRGALRTTDVPGLELTVREPRAVRQGASGAGPTRRRRDLATPTLVAGLLLGLLVALLVRVLRRDRPGRLEQVLAAWRGRRAASEPLLFRAVERACAVDDARGAFSALSRWQRQGCEPGAAGVPGLLVDLAATRPDAKPLLEELQRAVAEDRPWDGRALLARLPALRRDRRTRDAAGAGPRLEALNPSGDGAA